MPVFSLAYGSFGDIFTTAQLVVQIITTLRRGGRSSRGWRETENELKGLGNDLAQLTLHPPSDPVMAARVQQEVARSHLVMAGFFAKINSSTGLLQKLIWAVSEERELAAFRAQVIERRTALGVLLGLINSGALVAVQARVEEVCALVQDRVDDISSQVGNGNATIVQDMHDHISGIARQLALYQAQVTAVISQVPHRVLDETFVVVSPTGMRIPISVAFCTSYEILDGVLKTYMRGRREVGSRYVERGDYTIAWKQDKVIAPAQFMRTVQAGMHLEMVITLYPTCPDFFRNVSCHSCGHSIVIQELLCEFRKVTCPNCRRLYSARYLDHSHSKDKVKTTLSQSLSVCLMPYYTFCIKCNRFHVGAHRYRYSNKVVLTVQAGVVSFPANKTGAKKDIKWRISDLTLQIATDLRLGNYNSVPLSEYIMLFDLDELHELALSVFEARALPTERRTAFGVFVNLINSGVLDAHLKLSWWNDALVRDVEWVVSSLDQWFAYQTQWQVPVLLRIKISIPRELGATVAAMWLFLRARIRSSRWAAATLNSLCRRSSRAAPVLIRRVPVKPHPKRLALSIHGPRSLPASASSGVDMLMQQKAALVHSQLLACRRSLHLPGFR
ncbi:hypothetical protein K438DRAFT_1988481 [Mycena galopus ATCC 62051]|nr:hypothetical protein K438DRAFT_1988481 [Mycena galopus ATCC 62051]